MEPWRSKAATKLVGSYIEKRIEHKETERNEEKKSNPTVAPGPGNILRREVDRDQRDRGFQLCGFSSRIE